MVLRIRPRMMFALPFILMALMLGAQGTAVNDAPLGLAITRKEIQDKERQADEATGCEAYRADFEMAVWMLRTARLALCSSRPESPSQ